MDPAKQRAIASSGGKASHAKGNAHEFTSEEARIAGRKGGRAISRNKEHMRTIGARGGAVRGSHRQLERQAKRTTAMIDQQRSVNATIDGPSNAAIDDHWKAGDIEA
jgi:general stress protein YciG